LYSFQDLELLEKNAANAKSCKRAVIVGGGLIGIELAEMLHSRAIPLTFLVRESSFWNTVLPQQDSQLINREIIEHQIDLRLGTNLKEILPDDKGRARAVVLAETGEVIDCDFVGLTAGVRPNIDFLSGSAIETDKGVLVDRLLQTNIPNVYAIGDCAQQREPLEHRRAIEAVWYTGRMMGETVARTICGQPTAYNPGPWFNSAKFFNIEYQTYGLVSGSRSQPAHETRFHWEDASGKIAFTISYNRENNVLLGINSFGIRLRHEVLEQWLRQKKTIDFVVANLKKANFDPEFFKRYEPAVLDNFNQFTHTLSQ
jgi:NADPH-dependent 2,4-dienoyl-CoA reductase/sulfur reductase-like enzyme